MINKKILALLLLFCCISCDISKPFAINGKKEHEISSECGVIKIWGSSWGTKVNIRFQFDGEYLVDTDSLKIRIHCDKQEIHKFSFWLKEEKLTNNKIKVKEGEILDLFFDLICQQKCNSMSILPSSFIKCNDKTVITDTIDIKLLWR